MKNLTATICLTIAVLLGVTGCVVRQQDLDSWVGMPVEALDTHSLFITVPMHKTISASGLEIRNYANGKDVSSCSSNYNTYGSAVSMTAFTTCSSNRIICNNIFYIRDGKVLEYAPTGRCYTDNSVRPQLRYKRLSR
jgi:hypothetical protein